MGFISADFNGLLVDTEFLHATKVAQIANHAGFPVDAHTVFSCYSHGRSESRFRAIAGHFGQTLNPEQLSELVAEHRKVKREIYLLSPLGSAFEGARKALQEIRKNKHGLWISSNSTKAHIHELLPPLEMSEFFDDRIYTGEDVEGHWKPDPAMILYAMKVNHATPQETIHIGNDLDDVGAGMAAGIRTIIFVDPRHNGHSLEHAQAMLDAGAYAVFRDFSQLPELVELCMNQPIIQPPQQLEVA